ncbi:hypothetical protein E2C01_064919 [Portunus trituberculatus]|uniref:Uncharacterized protein n=1 Tax=Portunus trituberculatus TaxID=210409 RepID=A0A5B7HQC6_PORTR|nr:hypothetical protein [Portunus trituberculatus]
MCRSGGGAPSRPVPEDPALPRTRRFRRDITVLALQYLVLTLDDNPYACWHRNKSQYGTELLRD